MKFTLISRTATRLILPVMLVFSLYLFYAGHEGPGGGFSAGLIAAAAYALYAISFGPGQPSRVPPVVPTLLMAGGLVVAVAGALLPLAVGNAFFEAAWLSIPTAGDRSFDLGTPHLFEFGVYLTVGGVLTSVLVALEEAAQPEEEDE